jgi:DNA-binding NtrC family response regulator
LHHLPPGSLHPFGEADAHGIVGESPAAWRLRDLVAFVATRPGHVLVRGPSGSGKELVAAAIHQSSSRAGRRMLARNAATIPSSLMDAELFGHVKDYPNVGMPERRGLVGEADGSTLFLDEVGELSHELQAHLLRLMDGGEYQRLGRTETLHADVRLVGATNRKASDLKADFGARFRHVVDVPPLAERKEDVPLLVRHLLRKALAEDAALGRRFLVDAGSGPTQPRVRSELVEALLRHPLPLQVRQLDSILWQCLAASPADEVELIVPLDLGPQEAGEEASDLGEQGVDPTTLAPETVQACLDKHQGVQEKVWRELGLQNRYVLRRLIKKHGLRSGAGDEGPDGDSGPPRP